MTRQNGYKANPEWLLIFALLFCCPSSWLDAVAQEVAFYPYALNENKLIERPGSVRDYEVVPFDDGVLFLTDTELVFANWNAVTVLQNGLSTPKHLFVKGDRYYFVEGNTLYRGVGVAQPMVVFTHSHQIDEILYGDAQHKEIAFVSLDRPSDVSHQQQLYTYNFQSGVATDQGVAVLNGLFGFTGYSPRVQRRFVSGRNVSSSLSLLIGFRDVASGVAAQILWSDANTGNILGSGTEDWTFFAGSSNVYFITLDANEPNGFTVESISSPQGAIIVGVSQYHTVRTSPLKDPHHEGYLGFRFNDDGATILTRFSSVGYQDIADVSTFAPGSTLANSIRLQMATVRGHVFFYNDQLPNVIVRLMPDDTLVTLDGSGSLPINKSLGNIQYSLSAPGRGGSYRSYVEVGDLVYEIATMEEGSKLKILIIKRTLDQCPSSGVKALPGICGCSVNDTDSDFDGTYDCVDECGADPLKDEAGVCGCGVAEVDANSNGTLDCNDVSLTLTKPSISKLQRTVRVSFPRKNLVSYEYTYRFFDGRRRVIKTANGRATSGKRLSFTIPRRASSFGLSFLAKGPGYRDYRSPEFRNTLQ